MANEQSKSISFGIKDDVILIVAVGDMRAGECFALNEFILPYLDNVKQQKKIFIDLGKCDYMDSTFIGFIVALTKKCKSMACDIVRIANPSEKAKSALRKLSSMNEIVIIDNPDMGDIPVFRLTSEPISFSSRKNVELMFEAHQVLSELSDKNKQEFNDLLKELKRILDSRIC